MQNGTGSKTNADPLSSSSTDEKKQLLTFMPGLVTYLAMGDHTVMPAHRSGAACAGFMLLGILTAKLPLPLNFSANPPLPPRMIVALAFGHTFCNTVTQPETEQTIRHDILLDRQLSYSSPSALNDCCFGLWAHVLQQCKAVFAAVITRCSSPNQRCGRQQQ